MTKIGKCTIVCSLGHIFTVLHVVCTLVYLMQLTRGIYDLCIFIFITWWTEWLQGSWQGSISLLFFSKYLCLLIQRCDNNVSRNMNKIWLKKDLLSDIVITSGQNIGGYEGRLQRNWTEPLAAIRQADVARMNKSLICI